MSPFFRPLRSAGLSGVTSPITAPRVSVVPKAFAIASFIAGIAGSLLAYRQSIITFQSFTALGGLAVLATAYLAGITSVWGGILAGILAALTP